MRHAISCGTCRPRSPRPLGGPVDPADVRKVMLEEIPSGLPLSDPKVLVVDTALFGRWEMNWVVYNHGHDVALPGSAKTPITPTGRAIVSVSTASIRRPVVTRSTRAYLRAEVAEGSRSRTYQEAADAPSRV